VAEAGSYQTNMSDRLESGNDLKAKLIYSARAGEPLVGGQDPSDCGEMKDWGEDRTIQASELRRLLVDKKLDVHAKGVHLRAVKISGPLDLEGTRLRHPLRLEHCYFDGGTWVNLDYAKASLLILTGCCLAGLSGKALTVTKGLDLSGSTLMGRPPAPNITGNPGCTDADLTGAGSNLDVSASRGYALFTDGMKVGGNVNFKGLTSNGVCLNEADIAGTLDCTGAVLKSASGGKFSLWADGMKVGGNVKLDRCKVSGGAVRLSAAEIGGELLCHSTRLEGDDEGDGSGNALRGNRMLVGSNVNLESFAARGTVSLKYTAIGGSLRLKLVGFEGTPPGGKTTLDATGVQIAQELDWRPEQQVLREVILENAAVGRLADSHTDEGGKRRNGNWPTRGSLRLDGFTYGSITPLDGDHKRDARERLKWIQSQYDHNSSFATQPYEQLAGIYLAAGRDSDARSIAIARRQDQRKYGGMSPPLQFGNLLLDMTIKYGYQTWRTVVLLAVVYMLTVLFFSSTSKYDVVIPTQATTQAATGTRTTTPGHQASVTATHCTNNYPCFNPWGYAIDTVIPIVNVHQADFWSPNVKAPWGRAAIWVTYLGTLLGWLLTALAVAGYTGLVRTSAAP
jgi:hypothetical protein